jgi:seryl-tRNA synthetase
MINYTIHLLARTLVMKWLVDEEKKRAKVVKKLQKEAQKHKDQISKEIHEQKKEEEKRARSQAKEWERFGNRVKRALPEGASIVRTGSFGARVDIGIGIEVDISTSKTTNYNYSKVASVPKYSSSGGGGTWITYT